MRRRPCQADSLGQRPTRAPSPGRFPRRDVRPGLNRPARAARGRDRVGHAALAEPAAQRAEGLGVRSDCGRLTVKTPRHRRPTRQGEKRGAAPGSGAQRLPDPSPGLAPDPSSGSAGRRSVLTRSFEVPSACVIASRCLRCAAGSTRERVRGSSGAGCRLLGGSDSAGLLIRGPRAVRPPGCRWGRVRAGPA